jgi:hypothetical protein
MRGWLAWFRRLALALVVLLVAVFTPGRVVGAQMNGIPVPAPVPVHGPCGAPGSAPLGYDHVIWIWMENHDYRQVIGSSLAPFETALAGACGSATAYRSVGRPSLPNYIAATSGATQGIGDDLGPATHRLSADNIFRQVRSSGRVARSYLESMPANCALVDSGTYWAHHNPAAYYIGGSDRAACQSDDVPLGALPHDLSSGFPAFAFVAPNACHDMHDCPVGSGDAWLAHWLPQILSSPAYTSGKTAIFVVWDEYTPAANLVIAPHTPAGIRYSAVVDHYSLLRTTEDLLGLPHLGAAGAAASLRGPFGL